MRPTDPTNAADPRRLPRRAALAALPAAIAALGACAARPGAASAPAASATSAPPSPLAAGGPEAPELVGGGPWLNGGPLTLAGLRGTAVLVNFWTYGCYNCQNTLPSVRRWWASYGGPQFTIVGVHTPEFASEAELANVREAVRREQVAWPVVLDNDRAIWRAYGNQYWPRFYLVDRQGRIAYDHIGEGAYDVTERAIAAAIAAA